MSQPNNHYFYALGLPDVLKGGLELICRDLQKTWPFKRWVHHEDLHITLAFLGNAPEEKLSASIKQLEAGILCPTFSIEIDHLGVFGNIDSPRIFWAGIKHQPLLYQVRDSVYSACLTSGFELDKRPFNPHITLARKWGGEFSPAKQLLKAVDPFSTGSIDFQANKIILYKTHIGIEPKYESILTIPLQNN